MPSASSSAHCLVQGKTVSLVVFIQTRVCQACATNVSLERLQESGWHDSPESTALLGKLAKKGPTQREEVGRCASHPEVEGWLWWESSCQSCRDSVYGQQGGCLNS